MYRPRRVRTFTLHFTLFAFWSLFIPKSLVNNRPSNLLPETAELVVELLATLSASDRRSRREPGSRDRSLQRSSNGGDEADSHTSRRDYLRYMIRLSLAFRLFSLLASVPLLLSRSDSGVTTSRNLSNFPSLHHLCSRPRASLIVSTCTADSRIELFPV